MYSSRKKRARPNCTCKGPTLQAMHASPPSTPSIVMYKPSRTQNLRKKHITQHTYTTPPLASCPLPPSTSCQKCMWANVYLKTSIIHLARFPRVVREWDISSHGWRAITVNIHNSKYPCHNSKYPSRAYLCWPTILHYLTLNDMEAQEVQLLSQARSSLPPQPIQ